MIVVADIRSTYSPAGLRLIDEMTGEAPLSPVRCSLFVLDAPNEWRLVDLPRAVTPGGVLIFPDLGRSAVVEGGPRRYRAVLDADYYIPLFAARSDGFEFDVFPFNDENPPAVVKKAPDTVILVPTAGYPFAGFQRVLRGKVLDAAGPVARAEVSRANREWTVSDDRGVFALPMRLAPNGTPVVIDAIDYRKNRHAQISVTLPADLGRFATITIS